MSGDWTLPVEALRLLVIAVEGLGVDPRHATIVELGSGAGTARAVEAFGTVYTVEHDDAFLGRVPDAEYIHAPIVNGWYDADVLRRELPARFDAVIVDGPPGAIGRAGLLEHHELFPVPMLIDDAQRRSEFALIFQLASLRQVQRVAIHHLRDGRAFAMLGWERQ